MDSLSISERGLFKVKFVPALGIMGVIKSDVSLYNEIDYKNTIRKKGESYRKNAFHHG